MWKNILAWWQRLWEFLSGTPIPTPPPTPEETPAVETPPAAIHGFADCPAASVLLVDASGNTTATTADSRGMFVFENVQPGMYRIIPSKSGSRFIPPFRIAQVTNEDVWISFVDPTVWSPLDCRHYATFPNSAIVIQGSDFWVVQISCNSKIPPTDSRRKKPVDCRKSSPQNSRTAPPFKS